MIPDMRAKYKLGMLPLAMQQSNFYLSSPVTEDAKDLVYQRKLENTFFFAKSFCKLKYFLTRKLHFKIFKYLKYARKFEQHCNN